ncbi:hypothetical protein SOASR030_00990 [Leminorella grimontii]|uniref:DUF2589 domain-containing protein n=1 Tax=Leminorella grimontii TaxID=82981 RepID=A0AAV5N0K4_9GAMM|nr:DUF2589 domain-containing protein [Leminorella grimontii]KFC95444.1 hypothetical protein GLGR_1985 [Leminorella grimontii ATCC 33999 = DSM 5078]GKX53987.1 hypothetical protein SOASR030_00990 [Leminorella grimontii]GKX60261.1 hypothetical protein SOASR031_25760 [Leminorella grimontii]VFS60386.1 Protein of uncharacterised function (DUF2589) [Leminorella grimontii]
MSLKDWLRGKPDAQETSGENLGGAGGGEPPQPPENRGSPITLADITRGMQYAATAANQLIAHQYMQSLEPFFEPMPDGRLSPRTVQMMLDEKHNFDLPLIALATPRGLMLEEMKVHLTVRTDAVEQVEAAPGENSDTVGRFQVSLSPHSKDKGGRDSQHVDIEMLFKVLEPPESVMRLIDEYTNRVLPQPVDTEE